MFWNNKKKIEVITKILHDENKQFDVTIIALEKLESLLIHTECENSLKLTAMGTERDLSQVRRSIVGAFKELKLQCTSLNICAEYDDEEIFRLSAQYFIKNLYEWYAGREILEFYDEVDAAIIPIMYALLCKDLVDLTSVFEKYVFKVPINESESVNDKYEATRAGLDAWILAQHYFSTQSNGKQENPIVDNAIISHKRGDAVDGYIRIMKALMTMFYNSAPAKLVYQITAQYLPEIVESIPHINEEYIEQFFEKVEEGRNKEIPENKCKTKIDTFEEDGVKFVRLYCQDPNPSIMPDSSVLWNHTDNDCNGELYLGNNGCVYCKKCKKTADIEDVSFIDSGSIAFENKKKNEEYLKHLVKLISISEMGIANFDWLHDVITSVTKRNIRHDKHSILPILQEIVRQKLEEYQIEYNEIIIDLR